MGRSGSRVGLVGACKALTLVEVSRVFRVVVTAFTTGTLTENRNGGCRTRVLVVRQEVLADGQLHEDFSKGPTTPSVAFRGANFVSKGRVRSRVTVVAP